MVDLIIIGGGPAGLAAAVHARRKQYSVRLISLDLGGKTNHRLQLPHVEQPLVILGEEVVHHLIANLERLGCERETDRVERVERVANGYAVYTEHDRIHKARAVIIATGAHAQALEIPGEAEFLMRGLSYSAQTWAPLFAGQDTVVVGATALALQGAAELARTARSVTLIAPTPIDLSDPLARRLLASPNVTLWQGYQLVRVNGNRYARSLTVTKDEVEHDVAADGFFVALGLRPNSAFAAGLVSQSESGAIQVDCHCRTSAPGVFAAGDVTDLGMEQVLIALGEGAKAGLAACDYLLSLPASRTQAAAATEWR
jgi:alkyl hydroperoxide reductase subunit F